MNDLSRQIQDLRLRLRLQMLLLVGVLTVGLFTFGGADVVARVLIESDAWKIRTNNAALSLTDRLIVTTDVDTARIKVVNANIELAQQATMPATTTAGALWYDNSSGKLKYRNGSGWVEVGGSADTWRLEYTNATTLTLRGIANGGGSIEINGTTFSFASNPTLTAPTGTSLFWIYAYSNSGTVTLEASATAPTVAEYGVYGTKTGDATRRFVGMAYTTSSQFTADMIRSVKNENGYSQLIQYSRTTPTEYYQTNSTTFTDIDAANVTMAGLFFAKERINTWLTASTWCETNSWTWRPITVVVNFDGVDGTGGVGAAGDRGGSYAEMTSAAHSKSYFSVSAAGRKVLKGRFKSVSGYYGFITVRPDYAPITLGFESLR